MLLTEQWDNKLPSWGDILVVASSNTPSARGRSVNNLRLLRPLLLLANLKASLATGTRVSEQHLDPDWVKPAAYHGLQVCPRAPQRSPPPECLGLLLDVHERAQPQVVQKVHRVDRAALPAVLDLHHVHLPHASVQRGHGQLGDAGDVRGAPGFRWLVGRREEVGDEVILATQGKWDDGSGLHGVRAEEEPRDGFAERPVAACDDHRVEGFEI